MLSLNVSIVLLSYNKYHFFDLQQLLIFVAKQDMPGNNIKLDR